jgi:fructan beta-fructosidase
MKLPDTLFRRLGMFALLFFPLSAYVLLAQKAYDEPWRPQFHFTPPVNFMNDPNGLVYYKGEYHLFYQYNPQGTEWGHMSWGHAVSSDMLHWKNLPLAIPEVAEQYMIYSGSAMVDWHNASGLCVSSEAKDPSCLIAIYTAA